MIVQFTRPATHDSSPQESFLAFHLWTPSQLELRFAFARIAALVQSKDNIWLVCAAIEALSKLGAWMPLPDNSVSKGCGTVIASFGPALTLSAFAGPEWCLPVGGRIDAMAGNEHQMPSIAIDAPSQLSKAERADASLPTC